MGIGRILKMTFSCMLHFVLSFGLCNFCMIFCQGKTGYPFIDACMRQLRQEGWIHHLARHAVACFLTRGDLYQSWEEGQKVGYLLVLSYSLDVEVPRPFYLNCHFVCMDRCLKSCFWMLTGH